MTAGRRIEGEDMAIGAPIGARLPHEDETIISHRGHAQPVADPDIRSQHVPEQLAGAGIERDQVAVGGHTEQATAIDRHAARLADHGALLASIHMRPLPLTGRGIDGVGRIGGGDVHQPAEHDGARLKAAGFSGLEDARGY
jgi:hypothetical protein